MKIPRPWPGVLSLKPAGGSNKGPRSCQRRVATALECVVIDWVRLHQLPAPGKGDKVKAYDHPAEWASDMLTQIAVCLPVGAHRQPVPPG